jgi:ABC-type oligopeptide transport system substrate-binding subunit
MLFQQNIEPYDEQDIRQGIAAALNRTNLADVVFQWTAEPLYSMIPNGLAYHKPSFEIYGDANYTFTQEMFALHGYDDENPLEINLYYESSGHYPYSEEQAIVYHNDLEASGVIEVTLHSYEWPTYRQQRNAGTMDIFIYGWYPDYIDPDNYASLPFASWLNLGFNSSYGGDIQHGLWTQGRTTLEDERENIYHELQDLQAEQCSCVPLWQGKTFVVSKPNLDGVILDVTEYWRPWLFSLEVDTTTTTTSTTETTTTTTSASTTTTSAASSPTSFDNDLFSEISMIVTLGSLVVIVVFTILIMKSRKQMRYDSYSM